MAVPMQYGQQDAYAQQGIYSPQSAPGYADPSAAAAGYMSPQASQQQQQQQADMYGQQGYAGDPYAQAQPQMTMSPSAGALSPMGGYDQGYTNYMYGMQQPPPMSPPTPRRVILAPSGHRRRGFCNTDNVLTILIVCGTLFLVLLAMLLIVTVVVPRLTRKHRSSRKGLHEFPLEENLADEDVSALDAPQQQKAEAPEEDPESEHRAHHAAAGKHGAKDAALARRGRRRTSG